MKKNKGWAFVNDLDILGNVLWEENEEGVESNEATEDFDMFGWKDEPVEETKVEWEKTPETTEETPAEAPAEAVEESKEEPKAEEGEDLDKWLDELLKSSNVVDDKVDEIKDAAEQAGDDNLVWLIDELQTALAEKNLTIEELQKQVEVSNNRYLSKFGNEEELSIYKWEIEKLQDNPRLMALVKYYKTDNEKVKPKLIQILSDMIYDMTWQDVSELLDEKDKASMSVLNTPTWDIPPIQEPTPAKEETLDYDNSINNILWI